MYLLSCSELTTLIFSFCFWWQILRIFELFDTTYFYTEPSTFAAQLSLNKLLVTTSLDMNDMRKQMVAFCDGYVQFVNYRVYSHIEAVQGKQTGRWCTGKSKRRNRVLATS